jgi:GDP-mannose 6-dehydrogenase
MHGSILASNRHHAEHAIAKVMALGRRRIGMIGLSFKSGTDDLRESPLVMLAEHFLGKGMSLLIYDSEVHLSNLLGANRRFIEQHLPHVGSLIRSEIDAVIDESDVLVVGQSEPRAIARLIERARVDQTVIDLVRLPGRERLRARYQGLCWQ